MKKPPPTIPQIIDALVTLRMASLHTSMPGRVESYDKTTQTAQVQPLLKYGDIGEDGRTARTYGVVNKVPVIWLGGASAHLTLPLSRGDTGMLLFAEGSLDRHKLRGGLIDPEDDRRFHLSDAVFLPGYRSLPQAIAGVPDNAAVLTADEVRLGSASASSAVVVESALLAFGLAIKAAILTAPTTGVQALTALQSALGIDPITGAGWDAGTTKVKAE